MEDSKFWRELKALVAFLASGAFAAVHKEFMVPSPDFFPIDHCVTKFHHWIHFVIGALLQLVFLALLIRMAWHVLFGKQEPQNVSEETDLNGSQ